LRAGANGHEGSVALYVHHQLRVATKVSDQKDIIMPTHATFHINPEAEADVYKLRQAIAEVRAPLGDAAEKLRAVLRDEAIMTEFPIEAEVAIESAVEAIEAALRRLDFAVAAKKSSTAPPPGGPTRQQGQFLAFIREYMMRNQAGVAPSHADFQRFFNLTPPSVNSMLIRLEQRGFICRIPGKARAIELTIDPDWIPPLARPFRL
jgi:DNA-binding MarR family transcriptional regulator